MALLAILLYSLQQYADFSGGIDMVLGVAQLYGIEMMPNFRQPYFSTSLGDFWRRWHISLGAWMRDYLFYPLCTDQADAALSASGPHRIGASILAVCCPLQSPTCLCLLWSASGTARRRTTLPGVCITVLSLRWLTCWSPRSKAQRNAAHIPTESRGWHRFSHRADLYHRQHRLVL